MEIAAVPGFRQPGDGGMLGPVNEDGPFRRSPEPSPLPNVEDRALGLEKSGVWLVVDDDQPKPGDGAEQGRPRPDDDRGSAGPDRRPGLRFGPGGQPPMDQDRRAFRVRFGPFPGRAHLVDLGNEDENPARSDGRRSKNPPVERQTLLIPAPGQERGETAGGGLFGHGFRGPGHGRAGGKIERELGRGRRPGPRPAAAGDSSGRRKGEREHLSPRGKMIGGQALGEGENGRGDERGRVDDRGQRLQLHSARRGFVVLADDETGNRPLPQRSRDPLAFGQAGKALGLEIRQTVEQGPRKNDVDEPAHVFARAARTCFMSSQTILFSSLFPSLRTR